MGEVYGSIGGDGTVLLRSYDGPPLRLGTVILGQGTNGQKLDVNADISIGAGRELNATRLLREKVYQTFNITPRSQDPGRNLQGIIIHNKRLGYGDATAKWAESVIRRAASEGVNLTYL